MRSQLQPRMRIPEAEDGRLAASGGGFLASRRSSVESDSAGRRVGSAADDVREPPLEAPEPPSFEAPPAPLELSLPVHPSLRRSPLRLVEPAGPRRPRLGEADRTR